MRTFGVINDNEREIGLEEEEEEDGSVIEPLDTELLPIMNRINEISVDQLEGDEYNKLNLNKVYIDIQLLRLITLSLQQKAITYGVRRRNNNNKDIIFSRLMLCRVYSEEKHFNGSTLIYLMESKNSNQCLFNKNFQLIDNPIMCMKPCISLLCSFINTLSHHIIYISLLRPLSTSI